MVKHHVRIPSPKTKTMNPFAQHHRIMRRSSFIMAVTIQYRVHYVAVIQLLAEIHFRNLHAVHQYYRSCAFIVA